LKPLFTGIPASVGWDYSSIAQSLKEFTVGRYQKRMDGISWFPIKKIPAGKMPHLT
jgi:hypothetical protein